MAYFSQEYKTSIASQGKVLDTAWSRVASEPAILAVSTANGDVNFFLEEGDSLPSDASDPSQQYQQVEHDGPLGLERRGPSPMVPSGASFSRTRKKKSATARPLMATHLGWHPCHSIVASGWDDGAVCVWSERERVLREDTKTHKAPITLLRWSPEGSRLITGDKDGIVAVWTVKHTHRPRLVLLCQYNKMGAVTHCVFRAPPMTEHLGPSTGNMKRSVSQDSAAAAGSGYNQEEEDAPSFFFAGLTGMVYFADDLGHCSELVKVRARIKWMHFGRSDVPLPAAAAQALEMDEDDEAGQDYLVLLTQDVVLHKYNISVQGRLTQERKVKLSVKGDGSSLKPLWCGAGLIAAANEEPLLRVWSMEQDDNYVLSLPSGTRDPIICAAFHPVRGILVAGTANGSVAMWRYIRAASGSRAVLEEKESGSDDGKTEQELSEDDWEVLPTVNLTQKGQVTDLQWRQTATGETLLTAVLNNKVSIIAETVLHAKAVQHISAVQLSGDRVGVTTQYSALMNTDAGMTVKGLAVSPAQLVVWNYKMARVFNLHGENVIRSAEFPTRARSIVCYQGSSKQASDVEVLQAALSRDKGGVAREPSVLCMEGNRIVEYDQRGERARVISLADTEGQPTHMDICGPYLAVLTTAGMLKLWDVSVKEPKALIPGRTFDEAPGLHSVHVNSTGTKVALLSAVSLHEQHRHSSVLLVYDVDTDKVLSFDFGPHHYPSRVEWDSEEEKLLAVESRLSRSMQSSGGYTEDDIGESKHEDGDVFDDTADTAAKTGALAKSRSQTAVAQQAIPEAQVALLFATPDDGLVMQDSFSIRATTMSLIGLCVPYVSFLTRPSTSLDGVEDRGVTKAPQVEKRTMRDFVGLEDADPASKKDLLRFAYNLTIGNMDEAYRAVKTIQNKGIWDNMARMCVKTQRMDVAEVCLGNMGNARGAAALREARKRGDEPQAVVAELAIQLDMLSDAERLLKECKRYDRLGQLYRAQGRWAEAVDIATNKDRIHQKSVQYEIGRYSEATTDYAQAIASYERAGVHAVEVPRMLYDAQRVDDLRAYIESSGNDKELVSWWGSFAESQKNYNDALRFFNAIRDHVSMVRILCFMDRLQEARQIAVDSEDRAACYQLAKEYEKRNQIQEAIHFFTLAKRFNHGVRLAKEHGLDNDLMTLALESNTKQRLEAAQYFEEKGVLDKAVLLYQKGNNTRRALELCFQGQLFDTLRVIADDLGPETDPALLGRLAEFFLEHEHFEKAAFLLVAAKQYERALQLCVSHNIAMTPELADKLTPPKNDTDKLPEKKARLMLLRELAQLCLQQQRYNLACKKYTQAGDKVLAMKCLLKANDVEKVIYYANISRKREIFVLAANYLQNAVWQRDENSKPSKQEIISTVTKFYAKASAMKELSSFMEVCARIEVDDFREYERALGFLKEAMKCVVKADSKSMNENEREMRLAGLDQRVRLVERFVQARASHKQNPAHMIELCNQLLKETDVDVAVRMGDIFALLIEYYHSTRAMNDAYGLIQRMRNLDVELEPFLEENMLKEIHQAVGVRYTPGGGNAQHAAPAQAQQQGPLDDDEDDDDIADEVDAYQPQQQQQFRQQQYGADDTDIPEDFGQQNYAGGRDDYY